MLSISAERFEELVGEALDGIPEGLARRIDNVAVVIQEGDRYGGLLGLYEGIPLTERENYFGMIVPDRITIFREPILAICATDDEVRHQVMVTVVHEVGHHFGIDDDRLHELGWA